MVLKLRKDVFQRVAAERNVRSILFHFKSVTTFLQEPDVKIAVQALKTHGYRLGFIGDTSTCDSRVLSAFRVIFGNKTVLVTDSTLVNDEDNDVISVTLPSQSTDAESRSFLVQFVKGHVLVVPKRPVPRFKMLDVDEVSDLWTTAQLVGKQVELHYGASSLTFAIQDGKEAGQTIAHVHIHVIPRIAQDLKCNDDIYTKIEQHEQAVYVDNETRTARSESDMAAEAALLRPYFS